MWCNFTIRFARFEAKLTWRWRNWSSFFSIAFLLPSSGLVNDSFSIAFLSPWKWLFIAGALVDVSKCCETKSIKPIINIFFLLSVTSRRSRSHAPLSVVNCAKSNRSHKKALQNLFFRCFIATSFHLLLSFFFRHTMWSLSDVLTFALIFWKLHITVNCL